MNGMSLMLGTAFCVGTADALAKKGLQTNRVETIAFVRPGWGAFFLLPLLFFARQPAFPWPFWKTILISAPFDVAAGLLLHRALQSSQISLTIPYLAFTPVFLTVLPWFLLRESPTVIGTLGILCVAAGAFLLQAQTISFKDLIRGKFIPKEKGPLLMLLVALFFAITSTLVKKAILYSSPFYFAPVYYALIAVGLVPFQWKSSRWAQELVSQPKLFAAIGLLEALAAVLQFQAFAHANVAYVISIKRLSLLFSVFYGWLFF